MLMENICRNTPLDLIEIVPETGVLKIKSLIDADEIDVIELKYNIIVSDGEMESAPFLVIKQIIINFWFVQTILFIFY